MEQRFIVDEGYGSRSVAKWVRSEPQKSIWTGLKLRRKDKVEISSYRCRNCGYIESYA